MLRFTIFICVVISLFSLIIDAKPLTTLESVHTLIESESAYYRSHTSLEKKALDAYLTALNDPYAKIIKRQAPSKQSKILDSALLISEALHPNVHYIKPLDLSYAESASLIKKELRKLSKKNPQKLILDLRDSSGGLIENAEAICDFFIPKKSLSFVLQRQGETISYRSKNRPIYTGELYILVNKNTASISELISSSLSFYKKGTVVGEKTYGKSSVQKLAPLPNNRYLLFTVGKLLPPSGKSFENHGVTPDIFLLKRHLSKENNMSFSTHRLLKNDQVLQGALTLVNKAENR